MGTCSGFSWLRTGTTCEILLIQQKDPRIQKRPEIYWTAEQPQASAYVWRKYLFGAYRWRLQARANNSFTQRPTDGTTHKIEVAQFVTIHLGITINKGFLWSTSSQPVYISILILWSSLLRLPRKCCVLKLHVHFMFLHVLNTYVSRVGSCTWFKTQKFRPKMNVIQGLKLWRRPIFRLVPLVSRHRAVGSVQTAFILPFTLKLEAISYFETSIRQLLSYTQT